MKPIRAVVAATLLALCATGCASGDPHPAGPALGSDLTLRPGERTVLAREDLAVTFELVLNDSRCPPNVRCVWEGDATVRVSLAKPATGPGTPLELHTSARFPNTAEYGPYRVELLGLAVPADHATFRITRR